MKMGPKARRDLRVLEILDGILKRKLLDPTPLKTHASNIKASQESHKWNLATLLCEQNKLIMGMFLLWGSLGTVSTLKTVYIVKAADFHCLARLD